MAYRRHPTAFSVACSEFLCLPGLRGFWPMSSFDNAGAAYDLSGQGRTLSYNGNPTYNQTAQFAPYLDLDGTGDWLNRADEAGLDIIGTETYVAAAIRGLTLGGWWWVDSIGGAGYQDFIVKNQAAGNEAYGLTHHNANGVEFYVWSGAAQTITTATAIAAQTWVFAVGRFDPSTLMSTFVSGAWNHLRAGVPATIDNTGADLTVGGNHGGTALLTGYASMVFLCCTALADDVIEALYGQTRNLYGV